MNESELNPNNLVFMGPVTAKELEIRWRLGKMEMPKGEESKSSTEATQRTCYEMLTENESIIKHIDEDSSYDSVLVDSLEISSEAEVNCSLKETKYIGDHKSFEENQETGLTDMSKEHSEEMPKEEDPKLHKDFKEMINDSEEAFINALERSLMDDQGGILKIPQHYPSKPFADEADVQEHFEKMLSSLSLDVQEAVSKTLSVADSGDYAGPKATEDDPIDSKANEEAGDIDKRVQTEPGSEVPKEQNEDQPSIPAIVISEIASSELENVTIRKSPKAGSFDDMSLGKSPTPKALKSLKRNMDYRNPGALESPSPLKPKAPTVKVGLKSVKSPCKAALGDRSRKVPVQPAKLNFTRDTTIHKPKTAQKSEERALKKSCAVSKPGGPPRQQDKTTPEPAKFKTPNSKIPVKFKSSPSDPKQKLPFNAGAIPKTTAPKLLRSPKFQLPASLSKVPPSRLNSFPFAVDEKSTAPRIITGMKPPTPIKQIHMRPLTPTSLKKIASPIAHYIRNSPTGIMRSDKAVKSSSVENIPQQKENVDVSNLPNIELKKVVYVSNENVEISEDLHLPTLGPRQKEVVMSSPKFTVARNVAVKEELPHVLPSPRDSTFPLANQPLIEETSVLFTKHEAL